MNVKKKLLNLLINNQWARFAVLSIARWQYPLIPLPNPPCLITMYVHTTLIPYFFSCLSVRWKVKVVVGGRRGKGRWGDGGTDFYFWIIMTTHSALCSDKSIAIVLCSSVFNPVAPGSPFGRLGPFGRILSRGGRRRWHGMAPARYYSPITILPLQDSNCFFLPFVWTKRVFSTATNLY